MCVLYSKCVKIPDRHIFFFKVIFENRIAGNVAAMLFKSDGERPAACV
jgi:hypothetical protein